MAFYVKSSVLKLIMFHLGTYLYPSCLTIDFVSITIKSFLQ